MTSSSSSIDNTSINNNSGRAVKKVVSGCVYRIDMYFGFSSLDSGRISAGQQLSVSPSAYMDYTRTHSISSIGGKFHSYLSLLFLPYCLVSYWLVLVTSFSNKTVCCVSQ